MTTQHLRTALRAVALVAFVLAVSSAARAQATRTWVASFGDDGNPCSRTAPCKTFSGAISKTAAGGEIDAIDSHGYGAVTITKSLTIDGTSNLAGVLNASVNGVVVNDSATATPNTIVVTLRNLDINGAGTGLNGISFTAGKTLNVDHCQIAGNPTASPNGAGIKVVLASPGSLNVIDSRIFNNRVGITATASPGIFKVNVYRSVITHNTSDGLFLGFGAHGTVEDSKLAFNGGAGVSLNNSAFNNATVLDSEVHHNNIGLFVGTGTTLKLGGSGVNQNSTNFSNSGTIVSFCDNSTETAAIPGAVTTSCLH
jgi:hypothetical protein